MLTIIESPFAGDLSRNREYLYRCIRHSIKQGEIPFASHGFFTQYLDDSDPAERQQGIELGFAFWAYAHTVAFYADYGFSPGMSKALERLDKYRTDSKRDIKLSIRNIGKNVGDDS